MSVNLMLAFDGKAEVLEVYDTLAEAVDDARTHWCEDSQPTLFYAVDEAGVFLACLMRDQLEPEVCHTLFVNGSVEHHRCRYHTGADGRYLRTEVLELPHCGGPGVC